MRSPFKITVFDKNFTRQGWIGDALAVEPVIECNDTSITAITVSMSNRKLPLLLNPGNRLRIEHEGRHLTSGPIRGRSGEWSHLSGQMTFRVEDDFRQFKIIQGWPVPGNPLSSQTSEWHTVSGPAESVLKTIVSANANRMSVPLTIAPDQARGSNITVSMRFTPLFDRLFPAIEAAGLKATIRQDGTRLLLDVALLRTYPRKLSELRGVITKVGWNNEPPEATDVIVGGQGQGTARTFAGPFRDTALATKWGERSEVFVDARDTNNAAAHSERAAEAFAETGERSGLSLQLAEAATFRYGKDFVEGDRLKLAVGPGLEIEDIVRSVALPWTRDKGLVVAPKIGDITDDPDEELGKALRKVASGRRIERSR